MISYSKIVQTPEFAIANDLALSRTMIDLEKSKSNDLALNQGRRRLLDFKENFFHIVLRCLLIQLAT
ncbi:hypothetical protein HAX54_021151 [Datura stramonium]|uniref:Uncharacterized protein n=1 Tax=Datura stramonium TaxID=4076 RepID=A0ABS8UTF2_DATST|nr:hypothetical protein [Datura stramonium]